MKRTESGPVPTDGSGVFTLEQLYRQGRTTLSQLPGAGDNSPMEAAFLFERVLGVSRGELLRRGAEPAPAREAGEFLALVRRRAQGEPLQYLLGEWEFYGLPFAVGPGVLIPRPETELLVDAALSAAEDIPSPALLDLCSGSGCIPIALASRLPQARVWGVELSPEAMGYFRKNLLAHRLGNVTAVEGDVLALPEEVTCRKYHVITANPPYIPHGELAGLQAEVRWEPGMALDGGTDGLDFYRRLPAICCPLLEPGGRLILEIGEGQGAAVAGLLENAGFQEIQITKDLSGLERRISAEKQK